MASIMTEEGMRDAIMHEVRLQAKRVIEKEVEAAKAKVEREIHGLADRIALAVLSQYEVISDCNRIVVTVKKEGVGDGN